MKTTRPGRLVAACFAALVALAILPGHPPGSAAQGALQNVRVNEVIRSLFYTPLYVALGRGLMEGEGLKVTSFKTTWGTPATITEITTGGSDIALLGPEAAAFTAEAGPDKRLVNFAQLTNRDGSFILAKAPMSSFKITDLAGKTLVTGSAAGTPTLVVLHLLKKAGLDPKKDVTIRNIASFADVLPAFLNDPSAHFAQAFEPAVAKVVMEGRAHRVASVGELLGPVPYTAFVATADYMKKRPRVVQGFTNAIYRAQLWTEAASADEVVSTIEPYFKGVERPVMRTVVEQYKKLHAWAPNPRLSREGLDLMLDLIVQSGVVKRKPAIEDVVDFSFGEMAVKSVKR